MPNDFEIQNGVLIRYCSRSAYPGNVVIPDGVTVIGENAFRYYDLLSAYIPDGVTAIEKGAFMQCERMIDVRIPNSVVYIGEKAFSDCDRLNAVTLPQGVRSIGTGAFENCRALKQIFLSDSVTEIGADAFRGCSRAQIFCHENSFAHRYCMEHGIPFIFDYQTDALNGELPEGAKRIDSPFLADEEQPFVFISYSHKDRDVILGIIKRLYESGWKIWYDEGLTIGDCYDETLEEHVRNCAAFLLFETKNSLKSMYCRENEIPWAIRYGKPIIECVVEEGPDWGIREDAVVATVTPEKIEPALEKISGLEKGERRVAKGISVVVNPADREVSVGSSAYCLYTIEHALTARTILMEAEKSGCICYDAVKQGEQADKLENSACLIVFLDKAFLSDDHLAGILTEQYQAGKDIAICQVGEIERKELPPGLSDLYKMQWLNYSHGITADMNMKLARHLQKRGCRDTAVLPGFVYDMTERGIVITNYSGMGADLRIESEYGSVPVVEIGEGAFRNCMHLRTVVIPDSVEEIGNNAFRDCANLSSVEFGAGVRQIGESAFAGCAGLSSIVIPDKVTVIRKSTFHSCTSLSSVTIPGSVTAIGSDAFVGCSSLQSITIPESVTEIGEYALAFCKGLISINIPDHVEKIGKRTFFRCAILASAAVGSGVQEIGDEAFGECSDLTLIQIPRSVRSIHLHAFLHCDKLTVACPRDSCAWEYCKENHIPVKCQDSGLSDNL